jgi:integrase
MAGSFGKNAGKNVDERGRLRFNGGMKSPQSKTGRKRRHHDASWGETIVGLSHQPDGRWRVIGTPIRFTEPDERKAVARFRALERGDDEPTVHLELEAANVAPVLSLKPTTGTDGKPTHRTGKVIAAATEQELFAWFAEQIRIRPKQVAAMTGIEEIGYLSRLVKPEPLPTFAYLETLWSEKFSKSAEQRRKVLACWREFVKTTGIKGLEEITAPVVVAYRDAEYAKGTSGKSQQNTFTRIRRFLSFAMSRAVAVEELSRCLAVLALLTPNKTTRSLNPKPIALAAFQALLAKADDEDRAMLLLMLNCAMYCAEVVRLKWEDFEGDTLVSHRQKSGECVRVAVLWKETLDALAKLPRKRDWLFLSYAGSPLGTKGAEKRFRKLRRAADLKGVTSSQLRDGALTAAAKAKVDERTCKLLAGHSSGISDHYVKRDPSMVAPACDAVRAAYFANG